MRESLGGAARGLIVAAGTLLYLGYVFRAGSDQIRTLGLGDWIDPYLINGLMEHWFHVIRTGANPASPPMFHPAPHVLGYSHGLILFAPFYVVPRVFLHPFHAYTAMLFAAMAVGSMSLYALLRRLTLTFFDAFVLSAFFLCSANVTNGTTAVWTQRASVFLIPPILLIASTAFGSRRKAAGGAVAFVAGLLAGLMYVQDFYTAHFAVLLAAWFAGAAIAVHHRSHLAEFWRAHPRSSRMAIAVAAIAASVALAIFMYGGGQVRVLGVRLAARDWRRAAAIAVCAVAVSMWPTRTALRSGLRTFDCRRLVALLAGAFAGALIFLWIYLPAFREHSAFPSEEVWNALAGRDAFLSYRSFVLAGAVTAMAWLPPFRLPRVPRLYTLWLAAGSLFVFFAPLRFGDRSLWMAVIAHLPGFPVIRDPKRIIYLYDLAVVLATALVIARAPNRWYRAAIAIVAALLVIVNPNRERFDYVRPLASFDRWVSGPLAIDERCRSFYLMPASAAYQSRSPQLSALYGVDASFIALRHSIPTLNGYSAWTPDGWQLASPTDPRYAEHVAEWIARNHLDGVCALDLDTRVMRPR